MKPAKSQLQKLKSKFTAVLLPLLYSKPITKKLPNPFIHAIWLIYFQKDFFFFF